MMEHFIQDFSVVDHTVTNKFIKYIKSRVF